MGQNDNESAEKIKITFWWCFAPESRVVGLPSLGRTDFSATAKLALFLSCSLFDGFNKPSFTVPLWRCFLWHNFG